MAGDVVRDGAGSPWRVVRIAHEPGGRLDDGNVICWVELSGGHPTGTRTMRIPDARTHVEMSEGGGWGMSATEGAALEWAERLAGEVLGGTVVVSP